MPGRHLRRNFHASHNMPCAGRVVANGRSVAAHPQALGAVYIGVEEGGIYRSTDRGETWKSPAAMGALPVAA
jgi:hypothetical protein